MTELKDPKQIKAFYEEQLASQRGMLSSAIDTLVQKKDQLESALTEVEKRNFELTQISDRTFHDMREPMVALLGLLQMLREETASESAEYLLNLAEASVKRLDNFSLSLATYVREMQKPFAPEPIEASPFLEEVVASLEKIVGRERVSINIYDHSPYKPSIIRYDRERLMLILKNLIANGIKFRDIEEEMPCIDVAFRVKNDRIMFMIQDNGMGISPAILENVTKMFYRGSGQSTGVGLGLYMVKTLIDDAGDHLRIQSKEGIGTKVYLLLQGKNTTN